MMPGQSTVDQETPSFTHEGKPRDVVAQAGKTGFLYVFDRVTGERLD